MTTSAAPLGTVSKANAPRDPEKLQVLGPFVLKRIAEELGLFQNDDAKKAFLREPLQVRAQTVFDGLRAFDATGGGVVPVAAPLPVQAPPPAAAAPALVRTPVPSGPPMTNGAAHAPTGLPGTAEVLHMLGKVADMTAATSKAFEANTAELNALRGELAASRAETAAVKAQLDVMARLQHLTLGVVGQMAEGALNAPFKDVLEAVASEYSAVEGQVQELISGK